jgi:fructosamine-3-kinase
MAAGLPLLGLALTAGAAGLQYASANAMNQQYQKAQSDWVAYQRKQKMDFMQQENANRRLATQARNEGLRKLGDVQDTVGDETSRLTSMLGGDAPPADAPQADVANKLLSGQQGDEGFKTYLAKTLNQTAKTARNEASALAAMQAYTGGQFGLNNTTEQTLQDSSQWIDFYNQRRKGDQQVLRIAQNVPMKQVQASAGAGIGPAMASIGGSLMGGGGSSLAGLF